MQQDTTKKVTVDIFGTDDNKERFDWLAGTDDPPLTQQPLFDKEKFEIPVRDVCGSQRSYESSEYVHSKQKSDSPFKFVRPVRTELLDNISVGPQSGFNESVFTRFNSEYHEVLLIWDRWWSQAQIDRVLKDLQLKKL